MQGNGCRPAVAIDTLRLWAGGCGCNLPAWNGCRVPAGAIDALRLWAGGYVCSRGKDAGQLVLSGC